MPEQNYIRGVHLLTEPDTEEYFSRLPFMELLRSEPEFHKPVTYFVGENGMGKSTLLEAIAAAYGFNPEGGTLNFSFSTYDSHSELYRLIRLKKGWLRPRDGFFLRAESFYNVASYIEELDSRGGSGPLVKEVFGGKNLHEQSHGESFFAAIMNRFRGNGIYILDEPEAALSPQRQMSLLVRIHELVENGSQFFIATHSPIVLAYPDADIFELNEKGAVLTDYRDTQTYKVSRYFLDNTDKMLNLLLDKD